jgi:AraC-like DNA-binding protein
MRSLILKDDELDSGLLSLSKHWQTPIVDHTLPLPANWGTGTVGGLLLEEGLYMRYAHLSCREDIRVLRPKRKTASAMIFSLCYLLTPGGFRFADGEATAALSATAGDNNVFLSSNNMSYSVVLTGGMPCHFIELLMDWEWLQQHLAGMEEKVRGIEYALVEDAMTLLTERTRPAEEQLLDQIESELARCRINQLSLRGRLLLLLSGTLSRWPAVGNTQPSIRKTWHMQTIRQVEQRLVHSLEDMLPPQRQLAREFALSESTLKRHFKAVYGKTMYEYYLEKKMELAKRLLQEKKISVTETAYMLGYEKVSAFISMFKKIHKILPGSLK